MSAAENSVAPGREYFRVQTEMPLRVRGVDESEYEDLESEIQTGRKSAAVAVDPEVARWLDRIEGKLDRVLDHLGLETDGSRPTETYPVVLSGSGLRVPDALAASGFERFLVELELPGPPAYQVRCLAELVRRDPERGVALRFCVIHARDREAIVRHTLDIQRRELASRAERRAGA